MVLLNFNMSSNLANAQRFGKNRMSSVESGQIDTGTGRSSAQAPMTPDLAERKPRPEVFGLVRKESDRYTRPNWLEPGNVQSGYWISGPNNVTTWENGIEKEWVYQPGADEWVEVWKDDSFRRTEGDMHRAVVRKGAGWKFAAAAENDIPSDVNTVSTSSMSGIDHIDSTSHDTRIVNSHDDPEGTAPSSTNTTS